MLASGFSFSIHRSAWKGNSRKVVVSSPISKPRSYSAGLPLTSGGQGCQDGTDARGDAAERYDKGEKRVHRKGPPYASPSMCERRASVKLPYLPEGGAQLKTTLTYLPSRFTINGTV